MKWYQGGMLKIDQWSVMVKNILHNKADFNYWQQ